jgi:hypothetical protein
MNRFCISAGTTASRSASGSASRKAASTGCPPRPSGSTPAARERRRPGTSAATKTSTASRTSTPGGPTASNRSISSLARSDGGSRINSACSTCTATCGSTSATTGTGSTTRNRPSTTPLDRRSKARRVISGGSSGAARSIGGVGAAIPRIACGSRSGRTSILT